MATLNAAATLEQASDFATDYANSTLVIKDGATTLATHTVTSFAPTNTGSNGTATATIASSGEATIAASGTADSATLTSSVGGRIITLTVGTSATDLVLSTLTYVSGETSTVSSLVVTFPAA